MTQDYSRGMGPPGPSGPPPGPPPREGPPPGPPPREGPPPGPPAREVPPGPPPREERPYEPAGYYPPRPMGPIFSVKLIAILALVGIILFYVGGIICIGAINTNLSGVDVDDLETAQLIYKVGLIILAVGGLIALIALVGGGLLNKEIDPQVRVGMISMGIALLVLLVIIVLASPRTSSIV